MDVAARRSAWELIEELQADRVTVVLTTHLLDEAEHLADRVAIIDRGRLIAQGTLSELTRAEQPQVSFQARAGLDLASLAAALQAPVTEPTSGHYLIGTVNTPQLLVRLSGWLAERGEPLDALHAGRSSLEDVFLRLTGDDVEVAP